MQSLAGTLALMTKLTMVAVLLTGTPGYAYLRRTIKEEVCDTAGSHCTLIRETVESKRNNNLADVNRKRETVGSVRGNNSPVVQNGGSYQTSNPTDQSGRNNNQPVYNRNESKRNLNQQYYKSYPFVNPSSVLNDESERVSNQPVFQDYGSIWDQLRTRKALQPAIRMEQWLQKLTRGRTEGLI